MSLVPGCRITKLSSTARRGPIVIARGGSRLALGFDLARRILVTPLAAEETRE